MSAQVMPFVVLKGGRRAKPRAKAPGAMSSEDAELWAGFQQLRVIRPDTAAAIEGLIRMHVASPSQPRSGDNFDDDYGA